MEAIRLRFGYSPGVLVDGTLYVAGQVGRDAALNVVEGVEPQFVQAFENVQKVLAAAGAGFDDVVEMVTYHVDMRDLALFTDVKNRYFKECSRLDRRRGDCVGDARVACRD